MNTPRLGSAIALCALVVAWVPAAASIGGQKPVPPRGSAVGAYQREAVRRLLEGRVVAADSLRICVFRVSFTDRDMHPQHDSLYFANELRHLFEYYEGASRGRFELRWELMPGIIQLTGSEAYYGESDLWTERMSEILIQIVLERDGEVDFARYGAVAVIHAGAGRETDFNNDSPYQIYSGFVNPEEMAGALADTLGAPGVPTNDGAPGDTLYLDNLMIWPEEASQDGFAFGSLGIYAYQVGLRLGMVPLFDTTPEDYPDSQGCGNFDLMGYGIYNALGFVPSFPSAFNRFLMGWTVPLVITDDAMLRIADISTAAEADTGLVKIMINPAEYYLIENRVHDTNFNGSFDFGDLNGNGVPENEDTLRGAEFDFFLTATSNLRPEPDSIVTGSGLMIWHVDETIMRSAIDAGLYPNDEPRFKGVDLEEADGVQDLDRPGGGFSFGSFYDSYRAGNNDRFAGDTDPSSRTNAGAPSGIEISDISGAGHYMRFSARISPGLPLERGEFGADISRFPAIVPQAPTVGSHDRLVMAGDSGTIWSADAGAAGWTGAVDCLVRQSELRWLTTPVIADIGLAGGESIFIVSEGGALHAYDRLGEPLVVDTDGSPEELALRGHARAALIAVEADGDDSWELMALSSTWDSTYVLVLGYEGAPPAGDWTSRGVDGIETVLSDGRLAALPALGLNMNGTAPYENPAGLFFATYIEDSGVRFHFAPLWTMLGMAYDAGSLMTAVAGISYEPVEPFVICSGDINRDGLDEMAVAVPGYGLFYCTMRGSVRRARIAGVHPSSPVLADFDGDGTLETALRDEGHLYLFSGFGVSRAGWPIAIDPVVAEAYRSVTPIPAVAGDLNEDGGVEVLFRVGGAVHAFDVFGKEIPGWPLPGEGPSGGALALLRSGTGELYVADCAAVVPAGADGAPGVPVSSIRRYEPGVAYSYDQAWPCYRHDARGGARQHRSPGGSGSDLAVDPASFIIYPNPVRKPFFTARVIVSEPSRVSVAIFTVEGEAVAERERRHDWPAGSTVPFEETFAVRDFASGVYICRVEIVGDGWSWKGTKKFAVVR